MTNDAKPKTTVSKKPNDDIVLVHSPTIDGKGYNVLRKQGNELSTGEMRTLEPGKTIHGEVVRLKPREDSPALFDVKVEVEASPAVHANDPGDGIGRPAKVSTDSYRKGWDSIWATPKRSKPSDKNSLN